MIVFHPENHTYTDGEKTLISVTQLLRKHGLAPDYSGVSGEVLNAKAERGTLIHKEIEDFIKTGEIGFTEECGCFALYSREHNIEPLQSEHIVGNDIVAGTLDFLYREDGKTYLADFKTTSTLHKDAVSWQLSIYKHLLGETVDGLKAFHFTNGGLKVVDIREKSVGEILSLLDAEREGKIYAPVVPIGSTALSELAEIETLIKSIDEEKKRAEEKAQALRDAILKAMKENDTIKYETDSISVTYIAPSTRETFDTKRIKAERPEIFAEYARRSETKESIRVTIK